MSDDWRVRHTCPTTAAAANLGERLREGDFQHDKQARCVLGGCST
jgi:hypothetical protein